MRDLTAAEHFSMLNKVYSTANSARAIGHRTVTAQFITDYLDGPTLETVESMMSELEKLGLTVLDEEGSITYLKHQTWGDAFRSAWYALRHHTKYTVEE